MYPRLSDIFQDLFGFSLPFPIYSFGAMVALGALTAGWLTARELDRMYATGRIDGVRMPVEQEGKRKRRRKTVQEVSPSVLMWNITVYAVVIGFVGAKLFHILENLDTFLMNPGRMLFSSGGFTFYGGLILAAGFIAWYVRRKGLPPSAFADAVAPGLMIAYGIGRLGCHLAGDGDWGIASDLAARPDWLPTWLWAETYPNNILGVDLSAQPVYPTPIYEFVACLLLFGLLWSLRKHPFLNGWLFSLYLVLNGIERFFIEQIRVNNEFEVFGLTVTQAIVISVVLVLLGLAGLIATSRPRDPEAAERAEATQAASPA